MACFSSIPWLCRLDVTPSISKSNPPDRNFIANHEAFTVVGAEEAKSRTVNIRNRDDQSTQSKGELIPLQEALDHLVKLKEEKRRINAF